MMPPANSPIDDSRVPAPDSLHSTADNIRSQSPASLLPTLHGLASPVADFASILTYETEDDVDAANVSFLRTRLDPSDGMSAEDLNRELRQSRRRRFRELREQVLQERIAQSEGRRDSRDNRERRERWNQEVVPQVLENIRHSGRTLSRMRSPYGDGIPNAQSLYDWAPATQDDDDFEVERLLAELRRQQPNTHADVLQRLADVESRHRLSQSRARHHHYNNNNNNHNHRNSNHNDDDDENVSATNNVNNASAAPAPPHHEPSLRSAAILQSVRRNQQLSSRSRDLMQRYIMDRERLMQDSSSGTRERERRILEPWQRLSNGVPHERSRYEANRMAWQASQQQPRSNDQHQQHGGSAGQQQQQRLQQREHLEALRRRYLENPTTSKPSEFERIIKYLHVLRSPDHEFEKLLGPLGSCVVNKTINRIHLDRDVVLNMAAVCPPHPTSWLTPGTLFSGFQQAAPVVSSSTTLYRLANNQSLNPSNPLLSRRPSTSEERASAWLGQDLTSTPLRFASTSPVIPTNPNPSPSDRWTVKVTVHSVDYDTMTLQGTMEAYNVPSMPSPGDGPSKTTFSTYLEGELIDFTHHTLLTESNFNVKTTPDVDAAYWRKLEPFSKMTDDQIARALLDRDWIENELMGQYVLMRWKERCFVRPTLTSGSSLSRSSSRSGGSSSRSSEAGDSSPEEPSGQRRDYQQPARSATTSFLSGPDGNGYGLSISGFYYVSMRRRDGHCEGLYFDPQSSPYQHLELHPSAGMWGSGVWAFR